MRSMILALALPMALQAQEAVPAPADGAKAAAAPAPTPAPAPAAKTAEFKVLDDGLLEEQWFGRPVPFAKGDDVDFSWFKEGVSFTGRTLWFKPWEDPAMLKKGRDGKDNAKATTLTDSIPATLRGALAGALAGKAKVSRNEGDVLVLGRVVDCNAGSRAAKFLVGWGAGSEIVTYDLKFVDAATGELLAAVHHRVISGTSLSTIEDKMVKWADKFGAFIAARALK